MLVLSLKYAEQANKLETQAGFLCGLLPQCEGNLLYSKSTDLNVNHL